MRFVFACILFCSGCRLPIDSFFFSIFHMNSNREWFVLSFHAIDREQQLLPQKLLDENRARNIPALTQNQLAVIYKLIWYQDGYEQPSEEDLKRIMIVSVGFHCKLYHSVRSKWKWMTNFSFIFQTNKQQTAPDENEDQNDVHFRHITEITILTVQLIVEFAKGLPAFTKIPQEDQITLLKVSVRRIRSISYWSSCRMFSVHKSMLAQLVKFLIAFIFISLSFSCCVEIFVCGPWFSLAVVHPSMS